MGYENHKVLICMPTITGHIPIDMVTFLLNLHVPKGISIYYKFATRTLIHRARNEFLYSAVNDGFDYLRFLDDDNPPTDKFALEKLLSVDEDVVSGLVRARGGPKNLCVYKKEYVENDFYKYVPVEKIDDKEKPLLVDACGCGCVLIKRKVLVDVYEKYGKYSFKSGPTTYILTEDGYSEYGPGVSNPKIVDGKYVIYERELSEDIGFFERVSNLGYKIYANPNVHCNHIGLPEIVSV